MGKRFGEIVPSNGVAEVVGDIFGGLSKAPDGSALSVPLSFVTDLSADDSVHGFQNPFASDALVSVAINVETADSGETIDAGVAANATTHSDTLIDGGSVAAVGVLNGANDHGTNGKMLRKLDKKGGSNDFVTWQASTGTDTLAGQIVITFHSLNK